MNMENHIPQSEATISDYLRVLYRRRWVAILTFSVVIVSVAIHTLLSTPQYEASGLIEIQDENTKGSFLNEILRIGSTNPVPAEMEVIKSRTLAEEVVRSLQLDQRIFEQSPETLKVDLSEMNIHNRLKGKVFTVEFSDDEGEYEVSSDRLGDVGTGKLDEIFKADDIAFNIACEKCGLGDSFKFVVYPFRRAVLNIQNKTEVRKVGDNTGLVRIYHSSQYPELARNIVNKIIQIYKDRNREERAEEASQALMFIENQLKVTKKALGASETDLNKYKEINGVMLLDAEATGLIENLAKFEVELSQVRLQLHLYQQLYSTILANSGTINLPNFSKENTVLANLVLELVTLESERKNLLADFTEKHPQIIAISQKIIKVRNSIKDIIKSTVSQYNQREASLLEIIEKYNNKIKELPEKERELAELKRNATVAAETYTFLLQKLEEARIAKASTISNVRIIDKAVVPLIPISPNIRLNLLLGLLAGILLSIGVSFFLEFIDDSLKTVDEVERSIHHPIYGIIPRIPETNLNADGTRSVSANLVTHYSPKSPISEAFRTLRTNIHFADPDQKLRTLLVTSAGPSEGKSTIVSNLAITIANSGRKTLIVDCDLRKPNLHNIFDIDRDPGLTSALSGAMTWQEVIKHSKTENLDIITSGPIPPNPTEIIDSQTMKSHLEIFKKEYNIVLFDSPPIVAVTDAAILSSYTNGVLLVVELGRSRSTSVNRGIDLLEKVSANLLGLVTNNISSGYRYDYGYYYYYYYSSDGEKKRGRRHRTRYGY